MGLVDVAFELMGDSWLERRRLEREQKRKGAQRLGLRAELVHGVTQVANILLGNLQTQERLASSQSVNKTARAIALLEGVDDSVWVAVRDRYLGFESPSDEAAEFVNFYTTIARLKKKLESALDQPAESGADLLLFDTKIDALMVVHDASKIVEKFGREFQQEHARSWKSYLHKLSGQN